MKWSYSFIDISKPLEEGRVPEDFISLKSGERWMYLDTAPDMSDETKYETAWFPVLSGDMVRVPLRPYCTFNKDPSVAVAMALQIGMRIMYEFRRNCPYKVHLSIGTPVEELDKYVPVRNGKSKVDCFRFWLGVAIRTTP